MKHVVHLITPLYRFSQIGCVVGGLWFTASGEELPKTVYNQSPMPYEERFAGSTSVCESPLECADYFGMSISELYDLGLVCHEIKAKRLYECDSSSGKHYRVPIEDIVSYRSLSCMEAIALHQWEYRWECRGRWECRSQWVS
jgi:hypothetical protein